MGIDYTCENCRYNSTLEYDEYCYYGRLDICDKFKLDERTISEKEKRLLRVMRYVMRQYKSNK